MQGSFLNVDSTLQNQRNSHLVVMISYNSILLNRPTLLYHSLFLSLITGCPWKISILFPEFTEITRNQGIRLYFEIINRSHKLAALDRRPA